ncbi:MAG: methylmalonyl-CoA mutase [Chloroflexi bacterium]|nr:methylmalonyl-CoA mutase [Chloroflexota bacterium]
MVTEVETHRKRQDWERETVQPVVQHAPERRPRFETSSGITVQRLYTPDDTANVDYEADLGYPGEPPYTRGVYPTMYRGRFWSMRQYAGYASAEESNARYKYLLSQGQTGLSVAFDLPTQTGYDPDHPLAEGEVGKVGVSIATIEDMAHLFDAIPLDKVSTSMTINATGIILLALYVAVARRQGVDTRELRGTVQNDILKEYIARGTYIYPPEPSLRIITDIFAYCKDNLPHWNPISISGYHIREAGANAVQELAFTFANAIAYVDAALKAGLDVDSFAGQLSFFFVAQNELFEEVAKFRAARRIWAQLMQKRFQAQDPRSMLLRFHVQTAGVALTAQQPQNNIARVAIQALAAVLGGCQSLHTNSYDEALALPTEESAGIALRTQQIIAYESGVADTVDPMAGSYVVEALTNEIESRVWTYLDEIDSMGGALQAIQAGFIQSEIMNSAYKMQREIESKQQIVVGVNEFITATQHRPKLLQVNPALREQRTAEVQAVIRGRDQTLADGCLEKLARTAREGGNLFPPVLDAVEAYVSLGEICEQLRGVFGEYRPSQMI